MRRNIFSMLTVQQWSRLLRVLVQSPTLEVFQMRLDKALSTPL